MFSVKNVVQFRQHFQPVGPARANNNPPPRDAHDAATGVLDYLRSQTRLNAARARHRDNTARTNLPRHLDPLIDARFGGRPAPDNEFADDGVLHNRDKARSYIANLFGGHSSAAEVTRLVDMLMQVPPSPGSRYGNALCLALAIAHATGRDAARASAVVEAWARGDGACSGRTAEDVLATISTLTATDGSWALMMQRPRLLQAVDPSGRLGSLDTAQERDSARIVFTACAYLLENYPLERMREARPGSIDDVMDLARHIDNQAHVSDEEAAKSGIAHDVFRNNAIAANALLGELAADPTFEQSEALTVFKGGTVSLEKLEELRTRINRVFGGSGRPLKTREALRSSEPLPGLDQQKAQDLLTLNVMGHICSALETELNAPFDRERGDPNARDSITQQQFEHRVELATRLATLMVMGNAVASDGWREPMEVGKTQSKLIVRQAARLLGMKRSELKALPDWEATLARNSRCDLATMRSWASESVPDFKGSALDKRLKMLAAIDKGTISSAQLFTELLKVVQEGAEIDARRGTVKGRNNTYWANGVAAALLVSTALIPLFPTFTVLPTRAHTTGREGRVIMTGSEDENGAYMEAYVGTIDRDTRIKYNGGVMQVQPTGSGPFVWVVGEKGKHNIPESFRGGVIRVEGATLDECREKMASLFLASSDDLDSAAEGPWHGIAKAGAKEPGVSVRFHERHRNMQSDTKQAMVIGGVAPKALQIAMALPFGSKLALTPWLAGAKQAHRSVAHNAEVGIDAAQITLSEGSHVHKTTVPAWLAYPIPSLVLPWPISGGHGALMVPNNKRRKTTVVSSNHAELTIREGYAKRTITLDRADFDAWRKNKDGNSVPVPPPGLAQMALPRQPRSARGTQTFSVEQTLTEEAAEQLKEWHKLAAEIAATTGDENEIAEIGAAINALLKNESSYQEPTVRVNQVDHSQKAEGLPPWGIQRQVLDEKTVTQHTALEIPDPSARKFPLTPAEMYPGLFEAVQIEQVLFKDGKTFVDMIPRGDLTPEQIMEAYNKSFLSADFDLQRFVDEHFEHMRSPGATYEPAPKMPIMDHILRMWKVLTLMPTSTISKFSSLLKMKHPHIVPSRPRFQEAYLWDTYFTIRGLLAHARLLRKQGDHARANALVDLASGMVQNIADWIDEYGHPPNGGRTYYLNRSQIPLFTQMVRELSREDPSAAARFMPTMEKEHAYYMDGEDIVKEGEAYRRVIKTESGRILNRHWRDGSGPRQEMPAADIETVKLAQPDLQEDPDVERSPEEIFVNLGGGAESGKDYTLRWSKDGRLVSIRIADMATVEVNSILRLNEMFMARTAARMGDRAKAQEYKKRAKDRREAMRETMWNAETGMYDDYLWREKRVAGRTIHSGSLYALFGRVATHRQARQTIRAAQETGLLVKAGLRGSLIEDGEPQQWEGIWATEQDVARQGADNYAKVPLFGRPFRKFSDKIDDATVMRVETQYAKDGEIYEHYDKDGNPGKKSEYGGAQTGFGWSNAEYVVARERREQREERSSRPRLRMPPVLGRRF